MISLHQRLTRILSKCNGGLLKNATLNRFKSSKIKRQTAGIIVIGDEILKGQVKDTNSFYASELLYGYGVKVQKITIVPDSVADIATEIKCFLKRFDYIFTSGGIGPTHDDVTYEAMALAFNDTLHYHPLLMEIVKKYLNNGSVPLTRYKMAYVPTKSILRFGRNSATGKLSSYPCIVMENVYIFPGSPTFFKPSFRSVCKDLFVRYKKFVMTEIYINAKEESFADILSQVAEECPNVSFGSYPEVNRHYKVRITIESGNKKDTENARKMFCDRLPSNALVSYDSTPHVDCLKKFEKLLKESPRPLYENTLKKFVEYYEKPGEVWIYLDGSEESIMMVHLARVTEDKLQRSNSRLRAICSKSDAMNRFFRELCDRYNVELYNLLCDEINAPTEIKNWMSRAESRILLVGKRLNGNERETYDNLARLNEDISVPVQIHFPLIDWTNEDVASFFSSLSLPHYTIETQSNW
ncbi:FAD synthase [Megachile rotundata]|uniref:FAD synthase n=1 Tax=Megachile rotundata TaxID=143995 RepID=UPI000258D44D|nr:PREDICTED: FAD synthase-like [Megachile rotundata]